MRSHLVKSLAVQDVQLNDWVVGDYLSGKLDTRAQLALQVECTARERAALFMGNGQFVKQIPAA